MTVTTIASPIGVKSVLFIEFPGDGFSAYKCVCEALQMRGYLPFYAREKGGRIDLCPINIKPVAGYKERVLITFEVKDDKGTQIIARFDRGNEFVVEKIIA